MSSCYTYNLVEYVEDIKSLGMTAIRVSPHYKHTGQIVDVYKRRIDGTISGDEGLIELKSTSPQGFCNGYYTGGAGKDYISLEDFKANNLTKGSPESKEVII